MKTTINYTEAIEFFAKYLDNSKLDMFDISTMLCHMFEIDDKKKTMDDLLNERHNYLVNTGVFNDNKKGKRLIKN